MAGTHMEIVAAALRWHTARHKRLEIGAAQRRYQEEGKRRTGFGGASSGIGLQLTQARRLELAAARALFTLCDAERVGLGGLADSGVVDIEEVLLLEDTQGQPDTAPHATRKPWRQTTMAPTDMATTRKPWRQTGPEATTAPRATLKPWRQTRDD